MTKEDQRLLIGAAVAFVLLVAAFLTSDALKHPSFPERNGLYAVFLSNGQVYFGSIQEENENALILKGVYYIQRTENANPTGDVTLLKLGNEVHGPEDGMEVNRDHVLFIEKLKEDGRISQAIKQYK